MDSLKILVCALLAGTAACSTQTDKIDDVFVVPPGNTPPSTAAAGGPPLIPCYYSNANFLVDADGQVYFYQYPQIKVRKCGTGLDLSEAPMFIDLHPSHVVGVPAGSVDAFARLNVHPDMVSGDRQVTIAAMKDTVRSAGLAELMGAFRDKSLRVSWTFRKATQEEHVVMDYRKSGREYNPSHIKWNHEKIVGTPLYDGPEGFRIGFRP